MDKYFACYENGTFVKECTTYEELASWIISNQNDKLVCNMFDLPVLDTFGSFVNRFYDNKMATEFMPYLLKAQNAF